jgi:hypothetical protein
MAHVGHPLVGDTLYGGTPLGALARQALHACRLSFVHPVTGVSLSFLAPLPADLMAGLSHGGCDTMNPNGPPGHAPARPRWPVPRNPLPPAQRLRIAPDDLGPIDPQCAAWRRCQDRKTMNTADAKRVLETALICAQQPLPLREMRVLFNDELGTDTLKTLLQELQQEWTHRGVELVCVASGWRFPEPAGDA